MAADMSVPFRYVTSLKIGSVDSVTSRSTCYAPGTQNISLPLRVADVSLRTNGVVRNSPHLETGRSKVKNERKAELAGLLVCYAKRIACDGLVIAWWIMAAQFEVIVTGGKEIG